MSVGSSSGVWLSKESRTADKVQAELIPRTHGINWDRMGLEEGTKEAASCAASTAGTSLEGLPNPRSHLFLG